MVYPVIAALVLMVAGSLFYLRFSQTSKSIPEIPLPGVTGEWADSVFQTLSPEARIAILLLSPNLTGDEAMSAKPMMFETGGIMLQPDSFNGTSTFISSNFSTPTSAISWLPNPENFPGWPLPVNNDQLLSVSDDSLLHRFFAYHSSILQTAGSTVVNFPLWRSLNHAPQLPDTFYLKRQAELFNQFSAIALEAGLIPAIQLPQFVQKDHVAQSLHDTLINNLYTDLLKESLPILMVESATTPKGAVTLRQSMSERFGFKGLMIMQTQVTGHDHFFRNLQQGIDLQYVPGAASILIQRAAEQYLRDKSSRALVEASVMRVLLYKEWLRNHQNLKVKGLQDARTVKKLLSDLRTSGLVLLNDSLKTIPLSTGKPLVIHVPEGHHFTELVSVADLFADAETRFYKPKSRLALNPRMMHLMISVDGQFPRGDGWEKAGRAGNLVALHFGALDSLVHVAGSGITTMHAGDTTADSQAAVANALFGGLVCRGKMPRDLRSGITGGTMSPSRQKIRFQHITPESAGLSDMFIPRIDSIVQEAIANGAFPGCQVFFAYRGQVVCFRAYGQTSWDEGIPVTTRHLFDLASVTKVAATTLAFMKMHETGRMRTTDRLGKWFTYRGRYSMAPGSSRSNGSDARRTIFGITMYELLVHKSGLPGSLPITPFTGGLFGGSGRDRPPGFFSQTKLEDSADIMVAENLYLYRWAFDSLWERILTLVPDQGRKYLYNDANMVLLQQAIDTANGLPINEFLEQEFYAPLGLRFCTFNPLNRYPIEQLVPTALDLRWRRQLIHGTVHDPLAALYGGVAGNAGLFANAHDLGVIGQMLLNGGHYGGLKFLDSSTVQLFTSKQAGLNRGLGFDIPAGGRGVVAPSAPQTTYGHIGFTGTCLWVDPDNEIVFAFVSNRIHPNTDNQKINFFRVRERLHQAIYDELQHVGIPFRGREAGK